jgi:hypothetical protein
MSLAHIYNAVVLVGGDETIEKKFHKRYLLLLCDATHFGYYLSMFRVNIRLEAAHFSETSTNIKTKTGTKQKVAYFYLSPQKCLSHSIIKTSKMEQTFTSIIIINSINIRGPGVA